MLSNRRTIVALASAGITALSLAATTSTEAVPAAGTASSTMSALTLAVTGLAVPTPVTVFQAGTLATTDAAHPGNVLGAPWASSTVVPLVVAGEQFGAMTARSDEGGSVFAPATAVTGAGFAAFDMAATATTDSAQSVIGATAGSLDVLPGLVGLNVSSVGITSLVNGDGASNTQGLKVDGLDVSLGDLVPAEILAALPIDVLLDLLAQLPVGAPDLANVSDAATALVGDVRSGVEGVVAVAAGVDQTTAALTKAIADVASQEAIVAGLNVDLAAAQTASTNAAAAVQVASTNAANAVSSTVTNLLGIASTTCLGELNLQGCLDDLVVSTKATLTTAKATSAAATATVDQLTKDLAAATSLLNGLADVVDQLTDVLDALVSQLVSLVNDLLDNLNNLVAALTNLNGSLGGVIEGLLNTTLVGIDGIDLSLSAIATDDAATSTAGVVCSIGDITIAGISLGGGECDGSTLTGSLTGALDTVNGLLAALPLGDLVALPQVSLDLLDIASSVTEADGFVTSTATVVPLVLDIPSVDIDPANLVDGLLAQLSGDLLGNLLASLPAAATLEGLGLGDAAAALQTLTDTLSPALDAASTAVGDIVALLPDGSGLVALTTPGINLEIDPTSTASFRAGSDGSAPAPAPAPAPLPATGGGAIVLGALGLAGSWSLRRRG